MKPATGRTSNWPRHATGLLCRAALALLVALAVVGLAPFGVARTAFAEVAYENGTAFEQGVVLVSFEEGTTAEEANALLAECGLIEARELDQSEVDASVVEIRLAEGHDEFDVSEQLGREGIVAAAQPNFAYALEPMATSTSDPRLGDQWALTSIHATSAWDYVTTSGAVTIAALDSGVDVTHPDLAPNIVAPYNAAKGTDDVSGTSSHGTMVAGILAGVADNGLGVAGVSYNAQVMPIKVNSDDGLAYTAALVAAYDYILAHADEYNIRVVNISLGARGEPRDYPDSAFLAKIDEARAAGIVTVAAAGNGTPPFDCFPGDYSSIVSVMNLTQVAGGVDLAGDSNYNAPGESDKDICAPGSGILTTTSGGGYATSSGTSMAAPHVSAALALMFAANPGLTADEAVEILYATATDLGPAGWDERYGDGELNVLEAVIAAGGYERKEEPDEPETPDDQEDEGSTDDQDNPADTPSTDDAAPEEEGSDGREEPSPSSQPRQDPPLAEQREGTPPTGEEEQTPFAGTEAALAAIGLAMVFSAGAVLLRRRPSDGRA